MAPLIDCCWEGPPPPQALAAALRREGIALSGAAGAPRVVFAGKAPLREVGRAGRWIWVSPRAIAPPELLAAVAAGAYEALSLASEGSARALAARLKELAAADEEPPASDTFVSDSPASRRVLRQLALAARTSMPVLLTGETGTGKEVSARLIHQWSARSRSPFVPVNCAAIPNELMEGELFGYAKGAFSGAVRAYDGLLRAAEGGTVFLDEIDDTPHPLQVKLLRVLEDRVVTRLGESAPKQANFRILAATNRDLKELIARGLFGADLYERLAIVSVHLPPLRERAHDIPALARHFVERFYREEPGRAAARVREVSPTALAALGAYPWPGNIRELRNALFEALVYKRAGEVLLASDLPERILHPDRSAPRADALPVPERMRAGTFDLRRDVEALERAALEHALELSGGNATRAARLLGRVGRGQASDPGGTVRAMMRRLGVGREPS